MESVYNGYALLHIYRLALEPPPGLHRLLLRTLFSFNDIKLHGLSSSYTAKVPPGVLLLYGSPVNKCIFLGVIPVDETTPVSHTEPFCSSPNLRCDGLVVPAGVRPPGPPRPAPPLPVVRGLGSAARRPGGGGRLPGLGLAARGRGDGDWGPLRQLRPLPGCDGSQAGGSADTARGSLGSALRSRSGSNSVLTTF